MNNRITASDGSRKEKITEQGDVIKKKVMILGVDDFIF